MVTGASRFKGNGGVTLIEVVVAIVVLGIAVPPLIALFTQVAARTADHVYQGVGLMYAEGLMEEIVSKAFEDPDAPVGISFVASADSGSSSATTSHTVTIPAHAGGDLLVLAFSQTASGVSPATGTDTPSGWTKIRDVEAGDASAVRLTVFTKVGNGVESSVAVTTTVAAGFGATCCAYGGASGVVDASGQAEQESGVDMTAPSVVTTQANTRIVWCFVFDDSSSSETDVHTDPGFQGTLRGYEETSSPGNGLACALSDDSQAASGASATCVFSTNGGSDAGCAVTLALAATNPTAPFGPEEGSRALYDDIDDYDGMSNSPPTRLDGTALDDYGGFTRSAKVDNVTAADPDPITPEADGSTEFKRIEVTVAWTGGSGGEITLSTLRTKLGGPPLGGSPLDESGSAATVVQATAKSFDLTFLNATGSDLEIESFTMSADRATSDIKEFNLATVPATWKKIWAGQAAVPTGTLTVDLEQPADRVVPGSGSADANFLFDLDISPGPITFTIVLNFTDSSSATVEIAMVWS